MCWRQSSIPILITIMPEVAKELITVTLMHFPIGKKGSQEFPQSSTVLLMGYENVEYQQMYHSLTEYLVHYVASMRIHG